MRAHDMYKGKVAVFCPVSEIRLFRAYNTVYECEINQIRLGRTLREIRYSTKARKIITRFEYVNFDI